MKYLLTIVFCLTITSFFAQNKGINLIKIHLLKLNLLKNTAELKLKLLMVNPLQENLRF